MTDIEPDMGDLGYDMPREQAEDLLRTVGHGTLSLADDGVAYGIPISFGYDGENLYFVFRQSDTRSQKVEFVDRTTRGSLLVYQVTSKDDWASVVVQGELERISNTEWPLLRDALEDNAWFPSMFSETNPVSDFLGYRLVPDSITGRRGASYSR